MKNLKGCIEQAISNFDFEKVHKIMEFMDWKWVFGRGEIFRIPTIEEMRQSVRELFYDAIRIAFENGQERGTCSSGGFEVMVQRYKGEFVESCFYCEINFVVESYDVSTQEADEDEE